MASQSGFMKTKNGVEGRFLELVKKAFADNLLSVLAYGSYTSGHFVPGVSDVNVLIVLRETDHEKLAWFGGQAHRLIRKHRITPLVLTRSEFRGSADVFPMEYYDMRENHAVLLGEDETKPLELTLQNLRHQLEERLRGTVATLRQMLIASKGRKKVVDRSMKNLFGSMKALFRGLLRVKECPLPAGDHELIECVCAQYGLEPEPFATLDELRQSRRPASNELAFRVLAQLQRLIKAVDALA
jgi:predicted nucleotidyltransferase